MPQTPVSCGFKVLKRITTPLLLWMNKKKRMKEKKKHPVYLCNSACWCAFIFCRAWCFGFWTAPCVTLKKVLFRRPQQKNYLQNTLCQRAHKQDHLAIISSQSQIRAAKADVYREKWADGGRGGKIGQVERDRGPGERGWRRRRRRRRKKGELLEPGRGHGVPVERNSGKHP